MIPHATSPVNATSPDSVIETNYRGLPALELKHPSGASVKVTNFGAHIVSYYSANGGEALYMSTLSSVDGETPLRGGIPLVGPRFGQRNDLEFPEQMHLHGLLRRMNFQQISASENAAGDITIVLATEDSAMTQAIWKNKFAAEITLKLTADALEMELKITNRNTEGELGWQSAFHSYFAISELEKCTLVGLPEQTTYIDAFDQGAVKTSDSSRLPLARMNRIYSNSGSTVAIIDPGFNREIVITQTNSDVTVVWNPGDDSMGDLDARRKNFVCAEAGRVLDPVMIKAGESVVFTQKIEIKNL